MLSVERLTASYGPAQVLFDISFTVGAGEFVTLLGRNGMGKTTTIFTLMGLLPAQSGVASFEGRSLIGLPPYRIAQAGLGLVPEGRQVFPTLTVEENLVATGASRFGPAQWTLQRVYEFFPSLAARKRNMGNELSGGEQQMLAIGRILRTGARFLMLDEPTEGLAPVIIQQIGHTIARLKSEGFTILLVEQNFRFAATVADRYYIVEHGKIIDGFANSELSANMDKLHTYLGV
jgi:branched-chain amino acid transport system ATP-binding protein